MMDFLKTNILKKITKPKSLQNLYDTANPYDDNNYIDRSSLWTSPEKTSKTKNDSPIFSGILFSYSQKADKSHWFKAKFYGLFTDRLVLYSKKNLQREKRVILLKGVHLRTFDEIFGLKEWSLLLSSSSMEKRGLILYRKTDFEIFFPGPHEMYVSWLENLRKYCILHKLKRKFKLQKPIAQTQKSRVFYSLSLESGRFFAVKEYDKKSLKIRNPKDPFFFVENEINIHRKIDHEDVMRFYEVYESKKHVRLVLELLEGGDLLKKMKDPDFKGFEEQECKAILKQILLGVKCLHEKGVLHRDIKPDNVLFKKNEGVGVKLGDFDLGGFDDNKASLSIKCGTPGFISPEMLRGQKYSPKCDIFSVGVIFYMMYY